MVPVHWGTFNLAFHPWSEPIERVLVEAERRGATVVVPRPGERVDVSALPAGADLLVALGHLTRGRRRARSPAAGQASAGRPVSRTR